ncbi:MAG: ribosome-associated translation inhibitor RaiA [Bacteroidota bacterium]
MKVHTQSVHFSADSKLLAFIEKKLSKLDQFFDRIQGATVTLKLENSGQIKDKIAEVKLDIPGGILYVKETNKTFEASIDSAAAALKRQLIKYKERLRVRE